jgi:hypothetical protein
MSVQCQKAIMDAYHRIMDNAPIEMDFANKWEFF